MPLQIRCPECSVALKVSDAQVGKKIRCKKCQAVFVAQDSEADDDSQASPALDESPKRKEKARPARGAADDEQPPKRRSAASLDQEDRRPPKGGQSKAAKPKSSSKGLLLAIGLGVGVLAAAGIAIAVVMIWPIWTGPKNREPLAKTKEGAKKTAPAAAATPDQASPAEIPEGKSEMDAEQLAKQFMANRGAVEKAYANKELKVTGVMHCYPVEGPLGKKRPFELRGQRDANGIMRGVVCLFAPGNEERIARLVWGQTMKIRGKLDRSPGFRMELQLADCEIVEVGTPPAASVKVTAQELHDEYRTDRGATVKKYHGKIVDISGIVALGSGGYDVDQGTAVRLTCKDEKGLSHISCRVVGRDEGRAYELSGGQSVTIRGLARVSATGTPSLEWGHIVEAGEDPALAVSALQITKEIAENKESAIQKYQGKPLRLDAEIAAVKKMGDGWSLELAGFQEGQAKPIRIVAYVSGEGSKARAERLKSLKAGQTVLLRGKISVSEDRTVLAFAAVLKMKE